MSNLKKISNEKLTQVLREHEKWLSSGGKEGRRADLSFTDLRGKNFADFLPFKKISFVGSDLTDAVIYGTCDHVCFDRATLCNIHFGGVHFINGTTFDHANLTSACFKQAVFDETTSFYEADIKDANFTDSKIVGYIAKSSPFDRLLAEAHNVGNASGIGITHDDWLELVEEPKNFDEWMENLYAAQEPTPADEKRFWQIEAVLTNMPADELVEVYSEFCRQNGKTCDLTDVSAHIHTIADYVASKGRTLGNEKIKKTLEKCNEEQRIAAKQQRDEPSREDDEWGER